MNYTSTIREGNETKNSISPAEQADIMNPPGRYL